MYNLLVNVRDLHIKSGNSETSSAYLGIPD